jgi:hypothetical protein
MTLRILVPVDLDDPESWEQALPRAIDARQGGMIGQPVLKPIASEPPDRQIDHRLAHQSPIVNDTEKKACEHQADRRLRLDPGAADAGRVKIGHLVPQPG